MATFIVSAAALAAATHFAHGRGAIQVTEHSRGQFYFNVASRGGSVQGNLEYREATENQTLHVVRLPEVTQAYFVQNAVMFSGRGEFDGHGVGVFVRAFDGSGTENPDTLRIVCRRSDGAIAYEASGRLVDGDIVIRHNR
ncbi:MAG: hypothetical protein ACR2HJ_05880 [Fimbriimonadales bacterium]